MRKLSLAAAVLLSVPALALAQSNTTMSPPSPNAGSQMPQSSNSLPSDAGTGMHDDTTGTMHHHTMRHRRHRRVHHTHPSHAMSHTVPTPAQ